MFTYACGLYDRGNCEICKATDWGAMLRHKLYKEAVNYLKAKT